VSYFENQANEARRDLSNIQMNGGIGSSAYYDAQNRLDAARLNQTLHDPKPANPFGTWTAPDTWSSGGSTGTVFPGASVRSGPRHRHTLRSFGLLVLSLLLAVGVFVLVFTSVPPAPMDLPVMVVVQPAREVPPASGENARQVRQRSIDQFRRVYGHLYAPTAPWDDLLPKCDAKPRNWTCARLSMARVTGFQSNLLAPATFPADFCAAAWRDAQRESPQIMGLPFEGLGHALLPLLRLPEARWSLRAGQSRRVSMSYHVCSPLNAMSLLAAQRELREKALVVAFAGFLLVMVPGWWFARRMRRFA